VRRTGRAAYTYCNNAQSEAVRSVVHGWSRARSCTDEGNVVEQDALGSACWRG
jgi:hypothetical protein